MKVNETKEINGLGQTPTPAERSPAKAQSDKVSVEEARRVAELVDTARVNAGPSRAARLDRLEAAVRGGTYRLEASRMAEQLLTSAEIDAKLRAILNG